MAFTLSVSGSVVVAEKCKVNCVLLLHIIPHIYTRKTSQWRQWDTIRSHQLCRSVQYVLPEI